MPRYRTSYQLDFYPRDKSYVDADNRKEALLKELGRMLYEHATEFCIDFDELTVKEGSHDDLVGVVVADNRRRTFTLMAEEM